MYHRSFYPRDMVPRMDVPPPPFPPPEFWNHPPRQWTPQQRTVHPSTFHNRGFNSLNQPREQRDPRMRLASDDSHYVRDFFRQYADERENEGGHYRREQLTFVATQLAMQQSRAAQLEEINKGLVENRPLPPPQHKNPWALEADKTSVFCTVASPPVDDEFLHKFNHLRRLWDEHQTSFNAY